MRLAVQDCSTANDNKNGRGKNGNDVDAAENMENYKLISPQALARNHDLMAVAGCSSKKAAEDFDKIRALVISNGFNTMGSSMSDENSPKSEAMRKIFE